MAPGAEIFKNQSVPFKMNIRGTVNGKKLVMMGQGSGEAKTGEMRGKWVCSEPEVCPMSYAALQPTFGYGYRVYGQYPDNVVQWFQQCMPHGGYSQKRVTRFTRTNRNDQVDEEGTLTTFQTIRLEEMMLDGENTWVCVNDTTLEANFKEGSVLLQADALTLSSPCSIEIVIPFENGLKNYVQLFYPLTDSSGDVIIANQITTNQPLFLSQSIPLPPLHWKRVEVSQFKHDDEPKDHIGQKETNQFYAFEPYPEWSDIAMPKIEETKGSGKTEAPGPSIFKEQAVPLKMRIEGNVNGTKMVIDGQGAGDARIGELKGKWICSEPDVCPMSWEVLHPTLGYGYRVFGHYPAHIVQYFHECMPEGYTQSRITRFTLMSGNDVIGEEGTMTTMHTIKLEEGVVNGKPGWYCDNKVTLEANFKKGSVLLKNDALTMVQPSSIETAIPFEDGLKNYVQFFYPIKDSPGDVIIATQMTHNRPISTSRSIPLPPLHWKKVECRQFKDSNEGKDHIVQDEINKYYEFKHMAPGAELFKNQSVPFKMNIRGTVNGKKLVMTGQGSGEAKTGEMRGKWVCSEPEVCPMSYAALQPTFGYGYRVYGQYPDSVVQWFQQCMPHGGYNQKRVTRFTRMNGNDQVDEEGTLTTVQTIRLEEMMLDGKNTWVCVNDTILEANFKEGSVLLQADALTMSSPNSVEKVIPFENGLKNYVQLFYPLTDSSGDVIIANQITTNQPLFLSQSIPLPPPHWKRVEVSQFKHDDEPKDHIGQKETNQFYAFEPYNEWSDIAMPKIEETKGSGKTKAPGPSIFKEQAIPLKMRIEGSVNGTKMVIDGQGAGDARIGELKGKWICSEPEVCPMSWDVLHPTFGYGYRVFGHYPAHVVQFFHECMPEGYTQSRITRFTRMSGNDLIGEEGTMTTTHTIRLEEGVVNGKPGWYCDNKVTLVAHFKERSVLLKNDALSMLQPSSIEKAIPFEDGLKNYCQFFYPIKDSPGDVIIATQMTHNRPISTSRSIPLPPPHWKKVECRQFKDSNEEKDHIVQDEINKYYEFKN